MALVEPGGISSHPAPGTYRTEIDGLRAVAVGLVILHHFVLTRLAPGGFIGVDIFFVISGYLITNTLRTDLAIGMAGIAEFYRRRILRIFPALFVVMLACWAMEIAIRFPQTIAGFENGFLSALFFCSNVAFYLSQDYFDFAARDNALLHTWSLSVEEQFYLVLPLLLLIIAGLSRRWQMAALFGCSIVSLVAAEAILGIDKSAAFYLVPFRMWELMLGSALSLGFLPKVAHRIWAELQSLAGLALILAAAFTLEKHTPFPGLHALAPLLARCSCCSARRARRHSRPGSCRCRPREWWGWSPIRFISGTGPSWSIPNISFPPRPARPR